METTRPDFEEKNQQLTLDLAAAVDQLQGDAGRLQQVIWNLLRNASKFTPNAGMIAIRSWNEQDRVLVAVSDTGIGIDAEALPKIFAAFTQASESITRQFGGLGLSLAIAQAIVVAHHGELHVVSEGLAAVLPLPSSCPFLATGTPREQGLREVDTHQRLSKTPPVPTGGDFFRAHHFSSGNYQPPTFGRISNPRYSDARTLLTITALLFPSTDPVSFRVLSGIRLAIEPHRPA